MNPNIYGGKPGIRGYYPRITKEDIRACLEYARAVVGNEEIHVVAEAAAA